jgi:hypothetical protein
MGKLRAIPVLTRVSELIGLTEAIDLIDRSKRLLNAIARWCRQSGTSCYAEPLAPWQISAVALEAKQYEADDALDDLCGRDFSMQRVRRHVERLGLE